MRPYGEIPNSQEILSKYARTSLQNKLTHSNNAYPRFAVGKILNVLLFFIDQGPFKRQIYIVFKVDVSQLLIGREQINLLESIFWEKYWCPCNRSTLCRYQGISSVISLFWTREYEYTCACVDMQIGAHLSWTSRLLLSCSLTLLSCGQLINADYFFLLHIVLYLHVVTSRKGIHAKSG